MQHHLDPARCPARRDMCQIKHHAPALQRQVQRPRQVRITIAQHHAQRSPQLRERPQCRRIAHIAQMPDFMGVADPPHSAAALRSQLAAFRPELRSDQRVRDAVGFIRKPPFRSSTGAGYRILFAGAISTIPREHRRMLGLRRPWWPAITVTRFVLWLAARLLGRPSTSEKSARIRVARLAANV